MNLPPQPLNHRSAFKRSLQHARLNHANLLFLEAYLQTFDTLDLGHARILSSRLKRLYQALRTLGVILRTYDPLLGLTTPA